MKPLAGKRVNRINLEPLKGSVAEILQPFVFDSQPPEPSPSVTPSISVSPSPSPSVTPSVTPSISPSLTPSISILPSPSLTPSISISPSPSPSVTTTTSTISSNVVKYTTEDIANTIRINNVAFGAYGVQDWGPTQQSGFWGGIDPPLSGYTIYTLTEQKQEPSIVVAHTDSDVIHFARSYGGSNINTIAESINYLLTGSTNTVILNSNVPGIVTDGLVLNLDAALIPSYPRQGVKWTDLSRYGHFATLVSSPSFSTDNDGFFTFDGTIGSRASLTYQPQYNLTTGLTCSVFFRRGGDYTQLTDCFFLSRPPAWYFYDAYNSGNIVGDVFIGGERRARARTNPIPFDGQWYNIVYTYSSVTHKGIIYLNGNKVEETLIADGLPSYLIDESTANFIAIGQTSIGRIHHHSALKIYDRDLSATEILQNFNALKSRFGL